MADLKPLIFASAINQNANIKPLIFASAEPMEPEAVSFSVDTERVVKRGIDWLDDNTIAYVNWLSGEFKDYANKCTWITKNAPVIDNTDDTYSYVFKGNKIGCYEADIPTDLYSSSGDRTIEIWAKVASYDSEYGFVEIGTSRRSSQCHGIVLWSKAVDFEECARDYFVYPEFDCWVHLASVYTGGKRYDFLNGTLVNTVSTSSNAGNKIFLGSEINYLKPMGDHMKIACMRLSNVARYTADFSPSFDIAIKDNSPIATGFKVDLSRSIHKVFSFSPDISRRVIERADIKADTDYTVAASVLVRGDTERSLNKNIGLSGDMSRKTSTGVITSSLSADLAYKSIKTVAVSADLISRNGKEVTLNTDLSLGVLKEVSLNADTSRKTSSSLESVALSADTALAINKNINFKADVSRDLVRKISLNADSICRVPYNATLSDEIQNTPFGMSNPATKAKSGMRSMAIRLNELSLSDTFSLETTDSVDILQAVKGSILDFPYSYVIDTTDQQDLTLSANGAYDTDRVLYTPIKYELTAASRLSVHARAIARALGKNLVYRADDFVHTATWSGNGNTYASIIGTLFGWSSNVPHRQINVFMRTADNSLNIIQRGYETKVTDISSIPHTRPHIHRELVRTLWETGNANGSGVKSAKSIIVEPTPFSGIISAGESRLTYLNGLLVSEDADGNETKYNYVGSKETGFYVESKSTKNFDGSTVDVSYDYASTSKGRVLIEEVETQKNAKGRITLVRRTIHGSLGQGNYSTVVYENGTYVSSAINQGAPGQAVTPFIWEQESISLGGASYSSDSGSGLNDSGSEFIDYAQFPTSDTDMLKTLTDAIIWLNRKVKETVTTTLYNTDHVIDFYERVKLNGSEYYLVSNAITHSTRELKQELELVRWY